VRPEIQIETAVFPLRHPAVERSVFFFIAKARAEPPESPKLDCASVPETIADKLVGLTRRAGEQLAGLRDKLDQTLVRHIHDFHATSQHYHSADVAKLAREIMVVEAATRADDAFRLEPSRMVGPICYPARYPDGKIRSRITSVAPGGEDHCVLWWST
jgi:hypothetical protein